MAFGAGLFGAGLGLHRCGVDSTTDPLFILETAAPAAQVEEELQTEETTQRICSVMAAAKFRTHLRNGTHMFVFSQYQYARQAISGMSLGPNHIVVSQTYKPIVCSALTRISSARCGPVSYSLMQFTEEDHVFCPDTESETDVNSDDRFEDAASEKHAISADEAFARTVERRLQAEQSGACRISHDHYCHSRSA